MIVLSQYGTDDYSLWEVDLTEAEMERLRGLVADYANEGASVRGTLKDVLDDYKETLFSLYGEEFHRMMEREYLIEYARDQAELYGPIYDGDWNLSDEELMKVVQIFEHYKSMDVPENTVWECTYEKYYRDKNKKEKEWDAR